MSVMTDPPKPAFRLSQLIYDTRYRSITIQLIALALIAAGIWWLVNNTIANLNALGKDFDFGFLGSAAGYDINQMLIEYDSQSTHVRRSLPQCAVAALDHLDFCSCHRVDAAAA